MAKESMKAREVKRAKLVARYAEKRAALKKIIATAQDPAEAYEAARKLQAIPKDAKPNAIIKAVLQAGLLKDSNAVYQEFVNYGIDEAFWRMVAQGTGYQDMDSDLAQLAENATFSTYHRGLSHYRDPI